MRGTCAGRRRSSAVRAPPDRVPGGRQLGRAHAELACDRGNRRAGRVDTVLSAQPGDLLERAPGGAGLPDGAPVPDAKAAPGTAIAVTVMTRNGETMTRNQHGTLLTSDETSQV